MTAYVMFWKFMTLREAPQKRQVPSHSHVPGCTLTFCSPDYILEKETSERLLCQPREWSPDCIPVSEGVREEKEETGW